MSRLAYPSADITPKSIASKDGNVILLKGRFAAYSGCYDLGRHTYIGLCTGSAGRLYRRSCTGIIDVNWRPGQIGVALGHSRGEGRSPDIHITALGIDLGRYFAVDNALSPAPDLTAAAGRLNDDPLLVNIIKTMWEEAEIVGSTTLFFDHCTLRLLDRLAILDNKISKAPLQVRNFGCKTQAAVRDYIESRLEDDLSVHELARQFDRDVRSFTRAFRQSFGRNPFSYITLRKMERAKTLLMQGYNITETACFVGYSNPSKFSAAFRREFGTNPSKWKFDLS
ncbi:helix-turn-helix domain-containing protein [Gluconobacter thailandicus]|uniref:Helix-turn-helix domain-containing protein n=1 Tax=Gluconobacter thailandicus TaxID=257438 RepID=A0AAP9EW29_GLUTH|nr:AraC family transcriptional regulator [Gluconobacter thailandicus]QEH97777.1 helix-turn-helix domain-containing protein [Gluconobacter thailandicus]